MFLDLEEIENEQLSGSDSYGDSNGSSGSVSDGSADGSDGSADGSGGNAYGNDRISTSGIGGATGNGYNTSVVGNDADSNRNAESNERTSNGSSDDSGSGSRSERQRRRQPIRLGGNFGNRIANAASGSGSGSADEEELVADNISVRLGDRKQGRPRKVKDVDNARADDFKFSEVKDIVSMFLDAMFEIPAATLKQEFWRLSKDENKMLTEAIGEYVKAMPKSKSNWLLSFVKEHMPLVNLLMIAVFTLKPRFEMSIAHSRMVKAAQAYTLGQEKVKTDSVSAQPQTISTPLDGMFS